MYAVPPPPPPRLAPTNDGSGAGGGAGGGAAGGYGPFECWPRLLRERLPTPRPIPPLNFLQAPISAPPPATAPPSSPHKPTPLRTGRSSEAPTVPTPSRVASYPDASEGSTVGARPRHRRSFTAPSSSFRDPMGGLTSLLRLSRGLGGSPKRTGHPANARANAQADVSDRSSSYPSSDRGSAEEPIGRSGSRFLSNSSRRSKENREQPPREGTPPPPPPKPLEAGAWARERLGEVFACALLCHALRIPGLDDDDAASAVDAALSELTYLASLEPARVVPPQCAYHALLRACSHCGLPDHSRLLFQQLQAAGRRPDAQTIGWLSHALIEASCNPPSPASGGATSWSGDETDLGGIADGTEAEMGLGAPTGSTPTVEITLDVTDAADDPDAHLPTDATPSGSHAGFHAGTAFTPEHRRRSLSFTNGTFSAAPARRRPRPPPASPEHGMERVASLRVHSVCEKCGSALTAADATAGWYARHERDVLNDVDYGCDCPRCGALWQPMLRVDLVRIAPPSPTRHRPTDGGGGDGGGDGDGDGGGDGDGDGGDGDGDGGGDGGTSTADGVECPLLSPGQLLRELEALLDNSRERQTLREGWGRARHLFPSVFWSLCWHAAPAGWLRRLLPQLALAPLSSAVGDHAIYAKAAVLRIAPAAGAGAALVLLHPPPVSGGEEGSSPWRAGSESLAKTTLKVPSIPEEADAPAEAAVGVPEGEAGAPPPPPPRDIDFEGWVEEGHFVLRPPPALAFGSEDEPSPRTQAITQARLEQAERERKSSELAAISI